jgi:hypothetical protein
VSSNIRVNISNALHYNKTSKRIRKDLALKRAASKQEGISQRQKVAKNKDTGAYE